MARTAVSPVVSAGGPAEPEVNEVDVDENGWCFRRTRFEGRSGGRGTEVLLLAQFGGEHGGLGPALHAELAE